MVRSEGFWDISLSSNHATLLFWQLEVDDEVDGSWGWVELRMKLRMIKFNKMK